MAFLSFLGCESMVTYQFEVVNQGTRRIEVAVKSPQVDTAYGISAGASAVVLERGQLISGVKPYFEGTDTIWWFTRLEINNEDGSEVKNEVRLVSFWTFSEKDKQTGSYKLTLTDADFR
jgi:hypothetical protein